MDPYTDQPIVPTLYFGVFSLCVLIADFGNMPTNPKLSALCTLWDHEAHWKEEALSSMVTLDLPARKLRAMIRNLPSWPSVPQ